jgi:hypothetical protein
VPPFPGQEAHLWESYQRLRKQFTEYGDQASEQAQDIGRRIQQMDVAKFKSPWNIHYASHEPERKFSDLLFENSDLFDAFGKMSNTGCYTFPYSYKPANAAKTHVANENFNPDFFIKLKAEHGILVVEIKAEGDVSSRNRAKCRDGLKHFETLNSRLLQANEPWRYHFYFLSPEDYASFFTQVRNKNYAWRSGLMQELDR